MDNLIALISSAFADRPHPGSANITYCTYDQKNGGEFDGPCGECEEMAQYFADRSWISLSAADLRQHGDADSLFSVPAYCYFLPAYLIAAIREPMVLDVCLDHLLFRFGPDDAWGKLRLGDILGMLHQGEIGAVQHYFRHMDALKHHHDEDLTRALRNLEAALKTP